MDASRTPGQVRANLRFGLADGVGYSLMVGLGETYLPAFALALGFGEVFTGLLATLPVLAGAGLQLVSPFAVGRLRSRQRWVIACAILQMASFAPLVFAALRGRATPLTLIMAAALYWGANYATGPTWLAWMEAVVPRRIRTRYFARRTGLTQLAALCGILGGGLALQFGERRGLIMGAFVAVFAAAAASRSFSTLMLRQQTEPVKPGAHRPELTVRAALGRVHRQGHGSFLLYMLLVQLTVSIAAPYFTPYMLRRLGMPYAEYMGLLATAFLAKVIALLLIGRLARRWGTLRLLRLGGFGIIPLSALWLVSQSFGYLLALQTFAGCIWACYELGVFLLVFERILVEERTAVLTLYNLAHAFVSVTGSLIGAALLGGAWFGGAGATHAYVAIFAVSAIGRALTIPWLMRLGRAPGPPRNRN
jgi:MFS family permease